MNYEAYGMTSGSTLGRNVQTYEQCLLLSGSEARRD